MATVTNPALSNQITWDWANSLKPAPPGAILCFAFVAVNNRRAANLDEFMAFARKIWDIASGTGIDGSLIAGCVQSLGHLPSLSELEGYLNAIGVRDPKTGNLLHPGYRPGPGDGVVFASHPSATDPGLGTATGGAAPVPAPAPAPVPATAVAAGPPTSAPLGVLSGGAPDVQAVAQHALNDPLGWAQHHPFLTAGGAFLAYKLVLGGRR